MKNREQIKKLSSLSTTLFKDTKADSKDSEYILAIRGTESKLNFKHKIT